MDSLLAEADILKALGINPVVLGTQIVIFVITFTLLSRILFGRALTFMQQREEEITKAQALIRQDRAEVERMTKEYEANLAKVDKEGYDKTQAILKEAIEASQAQVGKAQTDARAETQARLAEIEKEKKDPLVGLRADVVRLSLEVAGKVMDTRLDPGVHGPAVQKFIQERSGS